MASEKRDQSIERLLRQSLKAPEEVATPACLDAETLAAWFDGGLAEAALEEAQAHAARCARCRSLVAAMARTSDAGAGASAPAAHAAKPSIRRWLAWGVPLTAAAAAVVLWIAVFPNGRTPTSAPAEVERHAAQAPVQLKPEKSAPLSAAARREAARPEEDRVGTQAAAGGAVTPSAPAASADEPATRAHAAVPGAPRQAFRPPADVVAETDAIRPDVVVASPDPSIRWRLRGPDVARSTDGGSTWASVFAGGAGRLTAGSAPSASTCWVVGAGGAVLRSTDGVRFARVAFPEAADLASVEATDARSASVTTADGRVFATADGGTTWTPR